LLKKDADGNIIGGAAKEWEVSEDGLTYTFTLGTTSCERRRDRFTADDLSLPFTGCLRNRPARLCAAILSP
jgi:ABC-type oligopeptide transport system substrate-binding subunit